MTHLRPLLFVTASLMLSTGLAQATEHPTTAHPSSATPHWGYHEDAQGPAHWGKMDEAFALCEEGQAQSPIDIHPSLEADLPNITFTYLPGGLKVVNNGHTIQVNVPAGSHMQVGADGYALAQFHFHTPSEYAVDGAQFPMELHFVHKQSDGVLGVVGVMIEEGAANPALTQIWAHLPTAEGAESDLAHTAVDITALLPADRRYYRFMGSLTTPPCSEGVNWHVMQQPITASKEQIEAFRQLFPMNARPLQPAHNRLVVKDSQ